MLCEAVESAKYNLEHDSTLVRFSSLLHTIERHLQILFSRLDVLCGNTAIDTSYGTVQFNSRGNVQLDVEVWERMSEALNKLDVIEGNKLKINYKTLL